MIDHSSISVLIVEDDPIIAHDISIILRKNDYKIVAVCHKATKALDQLSKGGIDVAILDIHLGKGQSGIDVARVIHEKYNLPYIFLTSFSDPTTLEAAQEQGPYGYLVKPFQEATLLTTISLAINNHRSQQKNLTFEKSIADLTDQEKVICINLYKGKSYQEIADVTYISINTVRYHVKNIYLKFNVKTRAELVAELIGTK